MKRFFLAALMAVVTLSAFGQTKKVAILETVDREKSVNYGVRLMLTDNLAQAITTTDGYEAYVRGSKDLGAILNEQDFQRTGYVSDAEIRKIGEMTGVQYVLMTEVGKIDESNIFVTAKILNVESAKIEMTANLMMKTDAKSMQEGTKTLAKKLLSIDDAPIVETNKYVIIERFGSEYCMDGKWMSKKEYYKFINNPKLCVASYAEFQKGKKLQTAGWALLGVGCGGIIAGGALAGLNSSITLITCSVSAVFIVAVPVPLLCVGTYKKKNAYKAYNEHCAQPAVTLNLQSSQNGLGLALNF